jgi:hypothetical protein
MAHPGADARQWRHPHLEDAHVKRLLTLLAAAALAVVPAVTGLLGNPSFSSRSPLSGSSSRPPGVLPDRPAAPVAPSVPTSTPEEGVGARGTDG